MMGVNRNIANPPCSEREGSNIVLIEDYYEASVSSDEPATTRSPRKVKKFVPPFRSEAKMSKKKIGVRQNRRSENTNYLLSLVEGEEGAEGTGSFMEITEPSITAFDELFMEQEKMKVWNDFINQPEEEQELLLAGEWVPLSVCIGSADKAEDESMEKEFDIIDKREVHPAFSAEECFQRVDSGFRAFLKRKHVPWGVLQHLETQIIPFFVEWPSSIFISQLPSTVDRLLLHALCQYLDLCSRSYNGDDGVRHTQVENRNETFISPSVTLSQFLHVKH